MAPKTSFITATKDRPDYLAEAIASVEAQTDQDWEHLVYDNASSDPRVADVLRAAKKRNPERFFFAQATIEGSDFVALYWNILIGLSRGRYITILDDDNTKHNAFLEFMAAPMDVDNSVDAVTCGWTYIDGSGNRTEKPDCHNNVDTSLARLWVDNYVDSGALIFRRSVIDKIGLFPTHLTTNEDWHFVIRLVKVCSVVHLDKSLLNYRVHSGSRSTKRANEAPKNWDRIRAELFPGGRP